jgi:hypothetical protein
VVQVVVVSMNRVGDLSRVLLCAKLVRIINLQVIIGQAASGDNLADETIL